MGDGMAAPTRRVRRGWDRLPVRWRLTAWYAALLTAALLILGIAMYVALRHNFYRALDEQVEDQAALTLITIQEQGGNLTLYPRDIGDLENDEHFVRLILPEGRIVADTSDALGGLALDQSLVAAALAGRPATEVPATAPATVVSATVVSATVVPTTLVAATPASSTGPEPGVGNIPTAEQATRVVVSRDPVARARRPRWTRE